MSRAPMNRNDLFFRSLIKSLETSELTLNGNEKTVIIPIQFNSQGELTVLDLVFKSVLDIHKGEFTCSQSAILYSNTQRKEEDKAVIELNSFLYQLRLNDEHFEAMEGLKNQILKGLAFGKRELNALRKEAGLPKEIGTEAELA